MLSVAISEKRYSDCSKIHAELDKIEGWKKARDLARSREQAAVEAKDYAAAAKYIVEIDQLEALIAQAVKTARGEPATSNPASAAAAA